jgi:hypothetical protein
VHYLIRFIPDSLSSTTSLGTVNAAERVALSAQDFDGFEESDREHCLVYLGQRQRKECVPEDEKRGTQAFCHSRNPDSEPTRQQSRSWFASAACRRETKLLFRFVQSKTSICIIRLSKKLVTRAKVGEQFFVDARLSENVASS